MDGFYHLVNPLIKSRSLNWFQEPVFGVFSFFNFNNLSMHQLHSGVRQAQ
ncbi:hypothetical Protein YC6258_00637 [Gynuella sunshinyii YC6258]|uniref:Uncharacterized protein n=1 Tax=Gynuella sunshinyii YC6258 TaxID=1445510 RepID=A0A0C5VDU4_9GAMM|nr:hypothetical Protein YC6258_00637 [Gynuella sunshinyii YC6258]